MLQAEMKLQAEDIDDASKRRRERDLRLSLYRAIYAGDLEAAEDAVNLLAMVDIDRELIWAAKREVRCGKVS